MATAGIAVCFHKPTLTVTTNVNTGTPLGFLVAKGLEKTPFEVVLELPAGLELLAGSFGKSQIGNTSKMKTGDVTQCTFKIKSSGSNKAAGRVYFGCDGAPGPRGRVRYYTRWAGGASAKCEIDVQAVEIPKCPVRSKRLMLGLGWWSLGASMNWPGCLDAFEAIGFNTVPVTARYTKLDDPPVAAFLEQCRDRGFKIVNVDSTFHHMLHKKRKHKEIFCQFKGGSVGKKLCPSYRGPHYKAEIERLAKQTAQVKASYVTCDIELWSWRGPTDAAKCTRCQESFKASGHKDIKAWQQDLGFEMWRDMAEAMRKETAKVGMPMPDLGGYDFRPGSSYQFFWPFDRLYPKHMHCSQASVYTPLAPYHLALIGNEVREDREKMGKSDVLPWISPGDGGTFPGDAFRLALLECFCNGARGVYFWSGRVWDGDGLAGFAHAIRNIAPVEDIIVDGESLKGAASTPQARVSGMRAGDRMVVLLADYYLTGKPKPVMLRLPVNVDSTVTDLDTGEKLGAVFKAKPMLRVTIGAERARLLLVEPTQD